MIRSIIQEPHPTLRKKAQKVASFNDPELIKLIRDMKDTMMRFDGLGLAAPQIDKNIAIFVITQEIVPRLRTLKNPKTFIRPQRPTVFINPRIMRYWEEKEIEEEGCLSIHDVFAPIARAQKVTIEAQNEKGQKFRVTAENLLARVFQHETDHLNGTLFIDRLHEK